MFVEKTVVYRKVHRCLEIPDLLMINLVFSRTYVAIIYFLYKGFI